MCFGNTCIHCGLVLGRVFQYEPVFGENNMVVQHTTPEKEWMPLNTRYNRTRHDQKALSKNREAFHQRLDLLKIRMPIGLKEHLKSTWDLLVEMGFSPSGTNSDKAGSFSLRVVVMAYMVWRLIRPRHEHVFDFDFTRQPVKISRCGRRTCTDNKTNLVLPVKIQK